MSNIITNELQAYYQLVDKFVEVGADEDISNGKPEHAVYLISKLFDIAKTKVRLYSDHLAHYVEKESGDRIDLYGQCDVIHHIKKFLQVPGNELNIVVENDVENIQEHPLFKALNELNAKNKVLGTCEIRKINDKAINWLQESEFLNHFMVTDDSASRLELDDQPSSYSAVANFGNKSKTERLITLFDNMHWKYATQIKVWG